METVKVNPQQSFTDIDDKTILDEKGKPINVADVLKHSIASELETDRDGTSTDVVERRLKHHDFLLDIRDAIKSGTILEYTKEEAKYLEERVAKCFHTLISAPMIRLLRLVENKPTQPIDEKSIG